MVFQKKGGVKTKQQQSFGKQKNKKQVEDDFDMDMDSDDDEDSDDATIQKTPANKTPKGKQVQSDRKVSFQIPGKNTPAKTPKGGNQVKKPVTPGKGSLQEFKGMGAKGTPAKNGKVKKQESESEEDDDDDDEDDDLDFDEDADLDMMLGDDDDEDDDDDDDDDDDEEDDDEDDDEEASPGKKQSAKQNQSKNVEKTTSMKNEKTPLKTAQKGEKSPVKPEKMSQKGEKTPIKPEKNVQDVAKSEAAVKTPSKAMSPQKTPKKEPITPGKKHLLEMEAEARRGRDIKTLFVGSLPTDVEVPELKALSSDIINVHLPRATKNKRSMFAFLEFANEEKAEENLKILQKKKFRGQPLNVDFTGEKSQKKPKVESEEFKSNRFYNFKKLFITSLSDEATIADVAQVFPKAMQICINSNKNYRSACILYSHEKTAAEELEAAKQAEICGSHFTVVFSSAPDKKKRKKKQLQSGNPAKKAKIEKKEESDDDDDDDSDE